MLPQPNPCPNPCVRVQTHLIPPLQSNYRVRADRPTRTSRQPPAQKKRKAKRKLPDTHPIPRLPAPPSQSLTAAPWSGVAGAESQRALLPLSPCRLSRDRLLLAPSTDSSAAQPHACLRSPRRSRRQQACEHHRGALFAHVSLTDEPGSTADPTSAASSAACHASEWQSAVTAPPASPRARGPPPSTYVATKLRRSPVPCATNEPTPASVTAPGAASTGAFPR
ncbi:Uncharacterized protein M6B38_236505 [Iris pallida]|uniref:Uncharacterized protein n=1 Tax=Iris pallida TaxID=29817 RepID=A0AAX6DP74_IRIPA|nr:Uncharacterized protein M6B38_236505 [Iris pallida]